MIAQLAILIFIKMLQAGERQRPRQPQPQPQLRVQPQRLRPPPTRSSEFLATNLQSMALKNFFSEQVILTRGTRNNWILTDLLLAEIPITVFEEDGDVGVGL